MKKLPAVIFALACVMALARSVYADNGTEMVVTDDLTVLGTNGTWGDPDFEVKGFTVFGSTVGFVPQPGFIPGPGSVVIRGDLQVGGQISLPKLSNIKTADIPAHTAEVIAVNSDGSAAKPVTINRRFRQTRRAPAGQTVPAVAVSSGTR